ncbi:hypothetical protein AB6A40_009047 [Gnathostoma spinigerum]|uniref:Uncharacterized protein n=1 Tax=Gnathostoma spinigerum TaxID=75299 RepID=A0ABD6ER70_9BILA
MKTLKTAKKTRVPSDEDVAATTIQRYYRNYISKRITEQMRETHEKRDEEAAVQIQEFTWNGLWAPHWYYSRQNPWAHDHLPAKNSVKRWNPYQF